MLVKRLKELIADLPDNAEIFIRNTVNPCGNIGELVQVEETTYGFFGTTLPCIVLNTGNSKEIEETAESKVVDYIKSE